MALLMPPLQGQRVEHWLDCAAARFQIFLVAEGDSIVSKRRTRAQIQADELLVLINRYLAGVIQPKRIYAWFEKNFVKA